MTPKYSVLVVDDQDNWRELLTEILTQQFEVVSASNYKTALQAIEKQSPPFHVVITDMRLMDEESGNEDGLKIVAHLNERGDGTKAVVITGYASIDSARRALSRLGVYDYVEKRPSNGSNLNIGELRKTVYLAAQEAEAMRPDGFGDLKQNILLLEPDPDWRQRLRGILAENDYWVDAVDISENKEQFLHEEAQKYALVLINELLADKKLLGRLYDSYPGAKIVILTSQDIDPIFKAMRDYPVVTAFNLHDEKFDPRSFREFIHSALAEGAEKYVTLRIACEDQTVPESSMSLGGYEFRVGKTYSVSLSIQDRLAINSQPILLLPRQVKKGEVRLHLFIHAGQMKVNPGTEAYWNIPLVIERPRSFAFTITPQAPGENVIMIEIDQDRRWLGRIVINTTSKT